MIPESTTNMLMKNLEQLTILMKGLGKTGPLDSPSKDYLYMRIEVGLLHNIASSLVALVIDRTDTKEPSEGIKSIISDLF